MFGINDSFKKINNRGQGLIEVIVSLFLIVVAILGALALATYTIRGGSESRERIQAALLAQEAIEVVKNNRDTYWLKGLELKQMTLDTNSSTGLLNTDNFNPSGQTIVGQLNGKVNGFSNFTRTTVVEDISGTDEKKITCTVSKTGSTLQYVKVIDYITNWKTVNH